MPDDDLIQHKSLVQPTDAIEMRKADHRRMHGLWYTATEH